MLSNMDVLGYCMWSNFAVAGFFGTAERCVHHTNVKVGHTTGWSHAPSCTGRTRRGRTGTALQCCSEWAKLQMFLCFGLGPDALVEVEGSEDGDNLGKNLQPLRVWKLALSECPAEQKGLWLSFPLLPCLSHSLHSRGERTNTLPQVCISGHGDTPYSDGRTGIDCQMCTFSHEDTPSLMTGDQVASPVGCEGYHRHEVRPSQRGLLLA